MSYANYNSWFQTNLAKQFEIIATQFNSITNIQNQFSNISKSFADSIAIATQQPFLELNKNFAKSIAAYRESLSLLSIHIDTRVNAAMLDIANNIETIMNSNKLDMPVPNAENLSKSIESFSDYLEENISQSPNDNLFNNPEDVPNDADFPKQIDWKFLIPLIISLLSLSLTFFNTAKATNSAKSNNEFQIQMVNLLEQINESCEQQANILKENNK